MTAFLQTVAALREQMQANLSRSDVLKALIWPMGILLTATLGSVAVKAPIWLTVIFTVLFVLVALLYGSAYLFCLLNDRDALRSERYSLHKLAIEAGVYGDSRVGLIDASTDRTTTPTALAPAVTTPESGND